MNQQIQATIHHCVYCFDILIDGLNGKQIPTPPPTIESYKVPLFVTWHIDGDKLRGCIGTFEHENLKQQLPKFTINSAFQNPRFNPIQLNDIERLTVGVSLLINFEGNKKAFEWEIGKHGILIEFMDQGRQYRGTFLPEVPKENNWDHKTTLQHLIKKAGCSSLDFYNIINKIILTTYESSKYSITYQEYLNFKKNQQ